MTNDARTLERFRAGIRRWLPPLDPALQAKLEAALAVETDPATPGICQGWEQDLAAAQNQLPALTQRYITGTMPHNVVPGPDRDVLAAAAAIKTVRAYVHYVCVRREQFIALGTQYGAVTGGITELYLLYLQCQAEAAGDPGHFGFPSHGTIYSPDEGPRYHITYRGRALGQPYPSYTAALLAITGGTAPTWTATP